jgi:carbon storage regulator CsrA
MLVLSRKNGESIKLGPDASVRVVEISGNRVQLGIEAPRAMRVLRGEMVVKTEVTVTEEVIDPPHAREAEELSYCLKLILGCMQYSTSVDCVDIVNVPADWTKRAMEAIAKHEGVAR